MQGYAQEICRTRFFVGLRIEVNAPGVLAAIRPCLKDHLLHLHMEIGPFTQVKKDLIVCLFLPFFAVRVNQMHQIHPQIVIDSRPANDSLVF